MHPPVSQNGGIDLTAVGLTMSKQEIEMGAILHPKLQPLALMVLDLCVCV